MAWIRAFKEANPKTKAFVFNWAIYVIALVASTIYCYARLDYVRTGKPQVQVEKNS